MMDVAFLLNTIFYGLLIFGFATIRSAVNPRSKTR
jgi:hypothetical protein